MKLSVVMISHNEEANIGRTLEAVKDIADEIVIVDSGSTDNTVAIAETYGATVYYEEWKGFGPQKNSATDKSSGEWVLYLDCDEVLTAELAAEIVSVINNAQFDSYKINRRTFYMGRLLKYAWQPDRRLRLVKRTAEPVWDARDVHETLHVQGCCGLLKNYLVHYSYKNLDDHMQRLLKYSRLGGEANYKKNKKASMSKLLINPIYAFFKSLILKRGILDGVPGVLVSWSILVSTYVKYAYLWEKQNNKK